MTACVLSKLQSVTSTGGETYISNTNYLFGKIGKIYGLATVTGCSIIHCRDLIVPVNLWAKCVVLRSVCTCNERCKELRSNSWTCSTKFGFALKPGGHITKTVLRYHFKYQKLTYQKINNPHSLWRYIKNWRETESQKAFRRLWGSPGSLQYRLAHPEFTLCSYTADNW